MGDALGEGSGQATGRSEETPAAGHGASGGGRNPIAEHGKREACSMGAKRRGLSVAAAQSPLGAHEDRQTPGATQDGATQWHRTTVP